MAASAGAVGAVSVSIATADALGLTSSESATWIMAQYGVPGLLSIVLVWRYRQPLFLIPNTTSIIFFGSLAGHLSWAEIIGATLAAGLVLLALGAFRLTSHLATIVPAPIIFGIIAGALMPFAVGLFSDLGTHPAIIGSMLVAYLLGPRLIPGRVPPIVFALFAGIAAAAAGGDLHAPPNGWSFLAPALAAPEFSFPAIVTIVPVVVTLVALQANLSSVVYLRSEGYHPPERVIDTVTGASTAASSAFGAIPVSLAGFLTPIVGGPEAGNRRHRHRSVYVVATVMVTVAVLAGIAAHIPAMIPRAYLLALIGLVTLGIIQQALREVTKGPLRLGPLFAFVVSLSDMTVFNLGPFFWALVIGVAVTFLLERREFARTNSDT
jgi:benzoate membrane transport protein